MKKCIGLLLCLMLLTGCSLSKQETQQTIFAMDTVMDLQIWGPDSQEAADQIRQLLQTLELDWSVTEESSFLSRLNRGEAVPDPAQQALLQLAQELSRQTQGAFDPQLLSVMELWGFRNQQYHIPDDSEIAQARQQSKWDLGGFLKGYAGAQAVEILKARDIQRAILNLGGNVQTYGSKPDGTPWNIAIENPAGGSPIGQVAVIGTQAVVTSGDYQRYFELDGIRYHHILDPKTGRPAASGLASVTVICPDGARADALSTALFVMGLEDGAAFWRACKDFEAVFVLSDGQIYVTENASFSGGSYEVIR